MRKIHYSFSGDFPAGKLEIGLAKFHRRDPIGAFTVVIDCCDTTETNTSQLFVVLAACYDLAKNCLATNEIKHEQKGSVVIEAKEKDVIIETHKFKGVFPTNINFGELDHSSNDCLQIEITWSFDEVETIKEEIICT